MDAPYPCRHWIHSPHDEWHIHMKSPTYKTNENDDLDENVCMIVQKNNFCKNHLWPKALQSLLCWWHVSSNCIGCMNFLFHFPSQNRGGIWLKFLPNHFGHDVRNSRWCNTVLIKVSTEFQLLSRQVMFSTKLGFNLYRRMIIVLQIAWRQEPPVICIVVYCNFDLKFMQLIRVCRPQDQWHAEYFDSRNVLIFDLSQIS